MFEHCAKTRALGEVFNGDCSMSADSGYALEILQDDGEFVLYRDHRRGDPKSVLVLAPVAERPTINGLRRLEHEYAVRAELEPGWAARPLALVRRADRTVLILEDPGGEPLNRYLGQPLEVTRFLRFAIGLAVAVGQVHRHELIHKDIKPANVLVEATTGESWLTGFGLASPLRRERQAPDPPEVIAGTLAYMAPEQTGRMNRSIDSRSDLYALGVTLYEMLTGTLPFTADDPMGWVHCHIARQPAPPRDRVPGLSEPLSAIVMKLLAKTAEDRYQTAAGLEADLRRCLAEWERHGGIGAFALGTHDTSDRLLIPEKLYGREREIAALLAAFERVVAHGMSELVLMSGYSGIGKSSVVNELHKVLVPQRGLFAAGKSDQYKRDVPYATLAQAFETLVGEILGKSEAELSRWRAALQEAVGANGQLIVDLIPNLELVIGKQSPVQAVPPQDAHNRFQMVFRRFLGVFARPEHPLALFLDDLQWLDAATLELIEHLVAQPDVRHLLLVGAYRDNEVDPLHPLMGMLKAIRQARAPMLQIVLAPLGFDDVGRLVADTLRCAPLQVAEVARLTYDKTLGNPFFVMQFLIALAEEQLLTFDPRAAAWRWDVGRIRAKSFTDNVVDLMVGKLKRLSSNTQEALKLLACVGNKAETNVLEIAHGGSREALQAGLSDAVRADLVLKLDGSCKFVHDRIQEAAYSLISEDRRAAVHLRIGRLLLAQMTPEEIAEHLFDVVDQLNYGAGRVSDWEQKKRAASFELGGATLLADPDEERRVAELNLRAGRRAKASTAYASACFYLSVGMAMLGPVGWESSYELAFALWLERAECEFLCGNFELAERLIAELLLRAVSKTDQAAAYRLKVVLHVMKSENQCAVDSALVCLRLFGIEMSAHPTSDQVQVEYEKVWQNLRERSIESLIDLPLMTDPEMLAAMAMLSDLSAPAHITDLNLVRLNTCHMVNLSLKYGTTAASTFGFAWFGVILGPAFHRYASGHRFGQLAVDLVQKHGFLAYKAKPYLATGLIAFWTQSIATAVDLTLAALHAGVEAGDHAFACYSYNYLVAALLARGDRLDEVWESSEKGLAFARKVKFRDAEDIIVGQQRFIQNMRGRTAQFSTFSDAQFDEAAFEAQLTPDRMATMVCWYWVLKVQARFMSGDYDVAIAAAANAKALLWSSDAQIHLADYHYFSALAIAAACKTATPARRSGLVAALAAHREQLREWADNCAAVFRDRYALVAAEIARIEGRELDAERRYEEAIRLAHEHGFIQNEGLANELAGRFHAARGFQTIAQAYLRNARYCYLRWGALGKVKQLDRLYPHLRDEQASSPFVATAGSAVEQLDLAAVIKASQAVSREIMPEALIETLMRVVVEEAGAVRGLLILPQGDDLRIEAEAATGHEGVHVALRQSAVTPRELPLSVLNYVLRTRKSVLLGDATKPNMFSADDYVQRLGPRSVLCLPLARQTKLIGLLYLENNLAPDTFTPPRIAVLEVVAAQAAISLETARLFAELQQENSERKRAEAALRDRDARIRRLVESNIIGILFWDAAGNITNANDAFLDIVGYSRQELLSGMVHRLEITPAEYRAQDEQRVEEIRVTGRVAPFEKEYLRKDGSRVPVLIGAALLEGSADEGVAFVLDLTERKRAEDKSRLLMEQAHDAILVLGPGGVVLEANRKTEILLGRRRDEMVGHTLVSVMEPADAAELDALLATGSAGLRRLRLSGADGKVLDVEVSAARASIAGQDAIILIARDITQRLQLEEQLRQSQKMDAIGQLTGGVAHDFNNILTVITGTIEILIDDLPDRPNLAAIAGMIDEAATRGADLTRQLLAFARKQTLQPRDTDINTLIIDTARLLRPTLGEEIEIESMLGEECWHAMIDPSQLPAALLNLAVNGRDAMPNGGKLTFSSANVILDETYAEANPEVEPGAYVMIAVSDTGIGIPAAIRDRVFEPFFTTKEIGKGTGLGLSMVYGFVKQSGGQIKIYSEEGHGTTIKIYLPRSSEEAERYDTPAPTDPQGGSESILVVEDDALVRHYVIAQFQSLGYTTISAANGPEALELVDRGVEFDLLFTDVIMPGGMNGRQLAVEITKRRPGVPGLYTSGYPENAIIHHGRLDPGVALLNKPYRTPDLARMVRQVLAARAASRGGLNR
jgi:PAS domain S-box-containing protein